MSRYARQIALPSVGADGQARLAKARVLVVGAGGLGCPVLQYLAGAGVGQLTIVDPDVVNATNLHRQTLYTEQQIGCAKAVAASARIQALNSACVTSPRSETLTPANAPGLIGDADIVLDCADSFAVSYTLSDSCLAQGVPLISASALGFAGYVGGFCAAAPSLRAVFPDLPAQAQTCATAGVMGPVVGALGAMQAQMALSVLLALDPSPLGQLLQIDMGNLRQSSFRFDDAPEPEGILPFIALDALDHGDVVFELRGLEEAPDPATPTAARKQVGDFDNPSFAPDLGQRAVLVCRSGLRAWQAGRKLRSRWPGEIALIAAGDPYPLNAKDDL